MVFPFLSFPPFMEYLNLNGGLGYDAQRITCNFRNDRSLLKYGDLCILKMTAIRHLRFFTCTFTTGRVKRPSLPLYAKFRRD